MLPFLYNIVQKKLFALKLLTAKVFSAVLQLNSLHLDTNKQVSAAVS